YSRSHTAASARPTLTKPKEYSKSILAAIRQLGSSTDNEEKASLPHRPKTPNIGLTMHHWIVPNGHRYSETRCAASKEVTQRVVSALVSNRSIRGELRPFSSSPRGLVSFRGRSISASSAALSA